MTENKAELPTKVEQEVKAKPKSGTKVRAITAAFIIAIGLPLVFLGDWFFFGLIIVICIGAIWEIVRCGKVQYTIFLYAVTFLISVLLVISPLVTTVIREQVTERIFANFLDLTLSPLLIFLTIVLLFFTVVVDKNFTVHDACFMFAMIMTITFGLQSFMFIRYYPNYLFYQDPINRSLPYFNINDNFYSSYLTIFVIISAVLSDTGGYFFGMLFGHYKMNERISPKKTWEGFVGGVATSFFICSLIGLLIPILSDGTMSLLDGILDLDHWYNILVLSFVLPTISVLGDFVFSSIKRYYGIKDFGNIFPGHGGILDRIDSMLFAFMAAASYINIWMVFTK